jgi:hypothetical protein
MEQVGQLVNIHEYSKNSDLAGAGTQTAALGFGGYTPNGTSSVVTANTELYNGSKLDI